jgi:hypothetical protein
MKFEIKDTVVNRWIGVIAIMLLIYLLFYIVTKTNESTADKNLAIKLIKQITEKNDSIISAKNKEIKQLLKENEASKKRVELSETIIDSLQNQINNKTIAYKKKKKRAGEFTDTELVNYWKNELD